MLEAALRAVQQVLYNLWNTTVSIIPGLVGAIIVLIIGYIVGKVVYKILEMILVKGIDLDNWLKKKGLEDALYGLKLSKILAELGKWYIYLLFIAQALQLVGLKVLTNFANALILFLPSLYASIFILIGGSLIGEFLKDTIVATDIKYKDTLGHVIKFLVLYFALVMALETLGIDATILIIAFQYAILALSIALGIGLGLIIAVKFREDIAKLIEDLAK